jgi:hypothetical protein
MKGVPLLWTRPRRCAPAAARATGGRPSKREALWPGSPTTNSAAPPADKGALPSSTIWLQSPLKKAGCPSSTAPGGVAHARHRVSEPSRGGLFAGGPPQRRRRAHRGAPLQRPTRSARARGAPRRQRAHAAAARGKNGALSSGTPPVAASFVGFVELAPPPPSGDAGLGRGCCENLMLTLQSRVTHFYSTTKCLNILVV